MKGSYNLQSLDNIATSIQESVREFNGNLNNIISCCEHISALTEKDGPLLSGSWKSLVTALETIRKKVNEEFDVMFEKMKKFIKGVEENETEAVEKVSAIEENIQSASKIVGSVLSQGFDKISKWFD